jgi:glyoxylate reductase
MPYKMSDDIMARAQAVSDLRYFAGPGRPTVDVLKAELAEAEGLAGWCAMNAELMDAAPKLKVIATSSVGFDHIDVAAASERGIIVCNTPDVLTDTTADLAFSLLMAAARRIAESDRFVRAGKWGKPGFNATMLGRDIHHATLGVIGMGRIGAAFAERGHGFHMKVLYYDAYRRKDLEEKYGYEYVDVDTLLRQSDFISLHVNLSDETRGMINDEAFAKMKPTAILVNASRGPVVDEKALIKALSENRIAGAGLDVFEKEPIDPNNPLLQLENVVVAPHIGSATLATRQAMANLAVDNVLNVVTGKAPLTPVNREVLAKARK